MTFVEVAHLWVQTEFPQQPPAANAQNDLLFQPHLGITAVQLTRDPAMSGGIGEVVRVQQKKLCSADEHLPAT